MACGRLSWTGWERLYTLRRRRRLAAIAERIGDGSVLSILPWIDGMLNLAELLDQVEQSTARISELVAAIKEYSYMDQAPQQEIDLHDGLESTLKILAFKLRKANIEVVRQYDRTLPKVCAYGSELNQVWTNLIDNAIDAMKANGKGTLTLRTSRDEQRDEAVIDIVDDGPGETCFEVRLPIVCETGAG